MLRIRRSLPQPGAGKQRLGAIRQPASELHTARWLNSDRESLQAFRVAIADKNEFKELLTQ